MLQAHADIQPPCTTAPKPVRTERTLAIREAALAKRAESLEQRAAALEEGACSLGQWEERVRAQEAALDDLAGSLMARETDLEAGKTRIEETRRELEAIRDTLARREGELGQQNATLAQLLDPSSLSDERSVEVVRMLDPDVGDAVRVMRRLGIEGSFEELVSMARQQLDAARNGAKRSQWSLFR